MRSTNPVSSVLHRPMGRVRSRLGLEPREASLLALMGVLVAVRLGAYTIAKALRCALFLDEFGALALPYAYLGVALSSAAYVWIESRLTRPAAMSLLVPQCPGLNRGCGPG